jgi:hypothetical protein
MPTRISIYGRKGERETERLRREMRSMSVDYNFYDVKAQPESLKRLEALVSDTRQLPKVAVSCAQNPGSVILTNPDSDQLRQTLYSEDVLAVTSYWI